ncbi:Nucleoside H+ symporter [Elusimicrobium minutum Pei191]|uniref:Nucleoside H+ symporter n=1 Tax=Elusimicrobium minutum (strain Pei191) TaxID=445932 RepID=B2KBL4_ELUMP|nr:nucleoside permease [Elusimicrobium minutum]ACC97701.1 Nucleoside H+ symporter [Elusimicrobium minutum Pei191]
MSIRLRLTVMNFLQFFIWGSWLITIANYWFQTKGWSGAQFGAVFSTMGIASLFMPALMGMLADRKVNAERLYGVLHIITAAMLAYLPAIKDPSMFFWGILVAMLAYMPTLALSNSIAYNVLKRADLDIVKAFPPIRVFGTIGFIAAMWIVNLTGNKSSPNQFYIAACAAVILGIYAFTLPACPPSEQGEGKKTFIQALGLDAFALLKNKQLALFFLFSIFLGAALQLTNAYGDVFLDDFSKIPAFANSYVVKYSTIIMSISQISETLFILTIPFFLKHFGIKKVMLISMIAWVFRFGLFAYADPVGRFWMIILSCIIYGMAFDFFNISGSLYVENTVESKMRSSAQGLFMMATNGFGAVLGSSISGIVIDRFFTYGGMKNWHGIWLSFAIYALVVAVLFMIFFKDVPKTKEATI